MATPSQGVIILVIWRAQKSPSHNDLVLLLLQWDLYEEGLEDEDDTHQHEMENFPGTAMHQVANTLALGRADIQKVVAGKVEAADCCVRVCTWGHHNLVYTEDTLGGQCRTTVVGKAKCGALRHPPTEKECKEFLKLADRCLPTEMQPLQGPQLLQVLKDWVSSSSDQALSMSLMGTT